MQKRNPRDFKAKSNTKQGKSTEQCFSKHLGIARYCYYILFFCIFTLKSFSSRYLLKRQVELLSWIFSGRWKIDYLAAVSLCQILPDHGMVKWTGCPLTQAHQAEGWSMREGIDLKLGFGV